jgi:hypothetical protein
MHFTTLLIYLIDCYCKWNQATTMKSKNAVVDITQYIMVKSIDLNAYELNSRFWSVSRKGIHPAIYWRMTMKEPYISSGNCFGTTLSSKDISVNTVSKVRPGTDHGTISPCSGDDAHQKRSSCPDFRIVLDGTHSRSKGSRILVIVTTDATLKTLAKFVSWNSRSRER